MNAKPGATVRDMVLGRLPAAAGGRAALALVLALSLAACGVPWLGGEKEERTASPSVARVILSATPPPATPAGNYLAGIYAESVGETGRAADYMTQALAQDPTNLELASRTYVLLAGEGRMEEAAAIARRLVETKPKAPIANLTLVAVSIKAGDYAAAETRLRALPKQGLNRVVAPLLLAWVLVGEDRSDAALAELGVLADHSGFASLYELHAGLINDVAGRAVAAERHLKQALADRTRMALRVVQALGTLYERSGKSDEARALYRRYKAQNAESILIKAALDRLDSGERPSPLVASAREGAAEALFNIASALDQDSTSRMALVYARMALDLRPDFPIGRLIVGDILTTQRRYAKANGEYARVDAATPSGLLARMRIALNLEALGKSEQAIARLKEMASAHPDWPEALIHLGDLLRERKQFDEAVDAYDRAVVRLGDLEERHWSLLYSRGIALERAGRWTRAETDFLRALELKPDQPYVLNYLGYSWVEQGVNLERARKMLERAVELRPNDGYIVDSLGWVFYRLGEYRRAVRELERAVELRPHDATINDHLGDAYWQVGRETEARFQWRRALTLNPEPDQAAIIQAKLERGLAAVSAGERGS